MNQATEYTKSESPRKGGVNYYRHFPKGTNFESNLLQYHDNVAIKISLNTDFLRPYGRCTMQEDLSDVVMARRLRTVNCEWLVRPGVAASELSETVFKNASFARDNLQELLHPQLKEKFDAIVQDVFESLAPLWTRPENPSIENISLDQLTNCFRTLRSKLKYTPDSSDNEMEGKRLPGDLFQAYVRQMIATGSSMYLLAIHLKCLAYILKNVEQLSDVVRSTEDLKKFKRTGDIKDYVEAIYANYQQHRPGMKLSLNTKRSLASFFESADDSRPCTSSSLRNVGSNFDESNEVTGKENEAQAKPKKKKKLRKTFIAFPDSSN